ncbi:hypothetical protein L218DRAFT_863069 [Marasmius fiardii PR-910]|nr:hypothetical protein L218DRAFT_863069 [Marasmius fiardii PR-910]
MSDATGPISGGTSSVMTVGASTNGISCNSTLPANDFFFTVDDPLTQCADFSFTNYTGAVTPLTIFVSLSQSFQPWLCCHSFVA